MASSSSTTPVVPSILASLLFQVQVFLQVFLLALLLFQTLPNFNYVAALATPNVTNLVTIKLGSVEDYLTWRTQFTSLLLSHKLMGFVDGSIPHPSPLLGNASGNHQSNPLSLLDKK
ncbi:hypothetical protein KY284_001183 [Solanum tuberosum]|nr:hypothetical protein KY284_001183 [Solanum tuberosum]